MLPESLKTIVCTAYDNDWEILYGIKHVETVEFRSAQGNELTGSGLTWAPSLKKVVVGEGITSLTANFGRCTELTQVQLPDSLEVLGDSAFSGCSKLRAITLPRNLTSIGNGAFKGCVSLQRITIPQQVT